MPRELREDSNGWDSRLLPILYVCKNLDGTKSSGEFRDCDQWPKSGFGQFKYILCVLLAVWLHGGLFNKKFE